MNFEIKDYVDIILAVLTLLSVIVSGFATKTAVKALKAQIDVNKYMALIMQTQRNENLLVNHPDLLEIHGISLSDLKSDNIDVYELLYLWSDLRQGEVYHQIEGSADNAISVYRATIMNLKKNQLIFEKYIYNRLMSDSQYTRKLLAYIKSL